MRPTQRTLLLALSGLPVALLPALADRALWPAWVGFLVALALVLAVEAWFLPAASGCRARVQAPPALYVGERDALRLALQLRGARRDVAVEVALDADAALGAPDTLALRAPRGAPARVAVDVEPARRGRAALRALWVRWTGPLGLLQRTIRLPVDVAVDVLPNVRPVLSAALRFHGTRTAHAGLKRERYTGDGTEFESLRTFVQGLDPRAIDWKASARHRELLCRSYRAERNHQVVLAFDTGHLMLEPLPRVPRLDLALNAGLLLGYACLRTGDRVGLYGFGARPGAFLAPVAGTRGFQELVARTAQYEYRAEETNFTLGLTQLTSELRRRSLVVVFTEFTDSVTAELMVENVDRLARRHLVVFVSLRDGLLDELADAPPRSLADVNRAVVADDLRRERRAVLQRLRRRGVHTVDATPAEVSTALLNRYFEIKRRELVG